MYKELISHLIGIFMADENILTSESKLTLEALAAKVNELETALVQNKISKFQNRDVIVIGIFILLGVICVGSVVLRLFISQPNWLDPFVLIVGLGLCSLSVFTGLTLKFKDFTLSC
jgi:hypothetical protein